jgi:hypothetical protein
MCTDTPGSRCSVGILLYAAFLVLAACGSDPTGSGSAGTTGAGQGATGSGGSAGGSGGSGGSGGDGCSPLSCYDGPAGTQDVGVCVAGTLACGATTCEGQVLPGFDDCATAEDEDCDGDAPACTGAHVWSRALGGLYLDFAQGLVFDDSGAALVVGTAQSVDVDLGTAVITGETEGEIYVAKYDGGGTPVWAKLLATPGAQGAIAAARGAGGGIAVVAATADGLNVDGRSVATGAGFVLFALDAAGAHVWTRKLELQSCLLAGMTLGSRSDGSLVLAGCFSDAAPADFGGGPLAPLGGQTSFYAVFDPSGAHVESRALGSIATSTSIAAAFHPDGGVIVAGGFNGAIDFGGSQANTPGGVFAARFDGSAPPVFAKFADAGYPMPSVAVEATGRIAIGDAFGASVVLLDAQGAVLDETSWIGAKPVGVAFDGAGNVIVGGDYSDGDDIGQGPMTAFGTSEVYGAKLSPALDLLWVAKSTNTKIYPAHTRTVAVGPAGEVGLSGYFLGTLDFGAGPITSHNTGNQDGFAVVLGP